MFYKQKISDFVNMLNFDPNKNILSIYLFIYFFDKIVQVLFEIFVTNIKSIVLMIKKHVA